MGVGALLGSGQVAEVFEWGDAVIKLYRPGQGKPQVFVEAANLARLEGRGLPMPKVHLVLPVDGRWGLVMDRAPGGTFAEAMLGDEAQMAPLLAVVVDLQLRLQTQAGQGLPRLRDRLVLKIGAADQLSPGERVDLLERLDWLPDGDRLCHGDFHPFNVMGTPDNPMIVDWLDATQGAPAADACRSYLLLLHYRADVAALYLELFLGVSGQNQDDVLAWLPVLAGARLAERVPDEVDRLLALVRGA